MMVKLAKETQEPTGVNLTPSLKAKLDRVAEEEQRTRSSLIRLALLEFLARREVDAELARKRAS